MSELSKRARPDLMDVINPGEIAFFFLLNSITFILG